MAAADRPGTHLITAVVLLLTIPAAIATAGSSDRAHRTSARPVVLLTSSDEHARAAEHALRALVLGRSVEGRPIIGFEAGDPESRRKVLVVGCVHGDECAGEAVTGRLLKRPPPKGVDLWVVPDLNPDGAARRTRGNAHGVDLNRNFPWRWHPQVGVYDSGPRPLSEPEARIAYRLIRQLRPVISIWFHQHLNLVDESGGNATIERRFSELVGLPLAHLTREPGSITTWENHTIPGTAFVVELPTGHLPSATASRFAGAIMTVSTKQS